MKYGLLAMHWRTSNVERIKGERPDVDLPCAVEVVHGLGGSDTRDD